MTADVGARIRSLRTARGLTHRFEANFREYEPFVGSEVKEVAIRAAA